MCLPTDMLYRQRIICVGDLFEILCFKEENLTKTCSFGKTLVVCFFLFGINRMKEIDECIDWVFKPANFKLTNQSAKEEFSMIKNICNENFEIFPLKNDYLI